MNPNGKWMHIAIDEAAKAAWPFGAVIVIDDQEIARAGSGSDDDRDPTAHAEVNVIRLACKKLDVQSLEGKEAVMYASCEPCALCIGAAWYAGIRKVIYGSSIPEMEEYIGYGDLVFPHDVLSSLTKGEFQISGGFLKDEVMEVYKRRSNKQ